MVAKTIARSFVLGFRVIAQSLTKRSIPAHEDHCEKFWVLGFIAQSLTKRSIPAQGIVFSVHVGLGFRV